MYEFYHYLPVNDIIMQWGLYLTGVGRGVIPSKDKYPPAGHPTLYSFNYQRGRVLPEFQIILITDGYGTFESKQSGQVQIKPNTFFMLFPDVWHRYKPDEKTGWKERWISFNGIIAHLLIEQGYFTPNNSVSHITDSPQLISTFDHFLNNVHKKPTENTIIRSLNTMALLSSIVEIIGNDTTSDNLPQSNNRLTTSDPLIESVLDLIWAHSHRPLSIDSIIKQVPASRRTLERRFQQLCGHSIHDEIIECRLSRAKRLLCETQMPIKTVAYLSGFSCLERMRCAFKNKFNLSPSEFRKLNSFSSKML